MYCKNCGSVIDDNAAVCPHCGVVANREKLVQSEEKTNTLAVVGFILSFFIAIAGLICSIIGYRNASQYHGKGKGMALAGIIISTISIVFIVIYIIILIGTISAITAPYLY